MNEEIYIEIPSRNPKIWGITKVLMYIAFAMSAFAFITMNYTTAMISIVLWSFLFIYSEDFRRILCDY